MRRVAWGLAAVALLWLVYWGAGRWLIGQVAQGVVAEQVSAGALAPGTRIEAGGFPVRFAVALAGLTGPLRDIGGTWELPELDVSLPAYAPWQIEADLGGPLRLNSPVQQMTLQGATLEADVAASPQPSLPLSRLRLAGQEVALASSLGWRLTAEALELTAERNDTDDTLYRIGGAVLGLAPDAALLAQLPALPAAPGSVTLAGEVGLTAPLDRDAAQARPGLRAIRLDSLRAEWGTMVLDASGEVTAEASGLAEGRILIRVTDWRGLLAVLQASGAVTPEVAPTVERMMAALAASSGDPEVLDLPLTFAEGFMSLGPFPLGPAPLLR